MRILKRFRVIVLAAVLAVNSCLALGVSAASARLGFSVSAGESVPGKDCTVEVKMNSKNGVFKVASVVFQLNYDKDVLEFKETSNVFFSAGNGYAKNPGILLYTAEDTYGKSIDKEVVLCKITFTVKSGAAKGESVLKLKTGECYDDSLEPISTEPSGNSTVNSKITVAGGREEDVIKLINDIGTVEYTPECNLKITNAESAYFNLKPTEQKLVTNYSVLLAARQEYQRLKTEFENKEFHEEINAYMVAHSYALSLTVENCQIEDETAVNAAMIPFETEDSEQRLSPKVLTELYPYYNKLKLVKDKIVLLIAEKEKQEAAIEADRKLREEAKAIAENFRKNYADLLATDPQNVPIDYLSWIETALTFIGNQSELNLYVSAELKNEKALLEGLLEICKNNGGEEELTETELAVKRFNNTFSYVLGLTEQTVTADDLTDIKIAVATYEIMNGEVKEKLVEAYSLLEKLLSRAEELYKADEEEKKAQKSETGNTVEKTVVEYIYVDSDGDGVKERLIVRKGTVDVSQKILLNNRSIGVFSIVLLIAFAVVTVNLLLLLWYYKTYLKTKKRDEQNEVKKAR